ncbi:uncharacterized protein CBL_10308 [Carabus blaptoides fortunei]
MALKYNHLVSFDDTLVGNVATTTYCIQNESNHSNFIIVQHPKFNSILNPFTVKNKHGATHASYEIIITYSPTVPSEKHVNYFLLKNEEKSIVLCVKGRCKELTVTASVTELIFYRLSAEKKTKATFTLTNTSKKSIQFQFDIDTSQNLFHIDPVFGEISAGQHVYIRVTFITENSGIFYLSLPCLILYYEPIIIELMAINSPNENKKILKVFQRRNSSLKFESCFERYCNLNTPKPNTNSACTLSDKYLDFALKNHQNLNSKLLEVKNNSDKCIKIQFDTDDEKIFALNFPKICLEPDASGYLEVSFTPAVEDKLYGSILYGRAINVDDTDVQSIPAPLILRITGSSFTGNNTWYPRLQVHPEIIRMPVVIPKEKVYTTFQLKNIGQYPIVFKFLAPTKSHFSILPRNGIIEERYQIFVVEFCTDSLENQCYEETWQIELNYMPDSHRELSLKALVENPRIKVGRNDTVRFGNIFPGCEQHLLVPVVNLTQFSLRYTFYNNQWINIENNIGELHNHETIHLKWTYTADLQVPEQFELKYELSVLQNDLQIGTALEFSVLVIAECSYTKLCATPNYSSLSELVCQETVAFSFNIFNFGNCEVNFKLKLIQNFDIPGYGNITMTPAKGTVTSKQSTLIEGTLEPIRIGPGTFCIKYYVTRSPVCDYMIDADDTTWPSTGILFKMDYCSAYPTLKIVDIGKNKAGPLFGKLNIWEFFQIEKLNAILRNIKANQSINFNVNIPEAQAAIDITKIFTFVIKNMSNINTTCKIVSKKNCECKMQEIYTSISIRKYSYEHCPHRNIMDITITDENIRAQDIQYIVIEVFYNLFGSHTTLHTMQLSHNRTINMYFHVKGLEPSNLSIFAQNLTFSMYNVFIGVLDADLQIFWFYNNTRKSASYFLDTDVLMDINMKYHTDVITCLNPRDKVAGKTVHALIFKYSPIDTEYFEVQLPLFLSGIKHQFTIYGRGTMYYRSPIDNIVGHGPSKEIYYHPGLIVHISTEHIIVPAIGTYSSITRIFCLKNISKDNHVAFCFESYYRANLIYATVEPTKGILKPKECLWLKIRLFTYGQACTIRLTCCCHLLDKTALFKHIQSCTDYHQEATILHDQFEITSKGITYPKSTITLEPQPTIFHRILAVSCHIVGTPDRDFKMSLHQQLKQLPVPHISLYTPDIFAKMFSVRRLLTDNVEQPINTLYAKRIMKQLQNPQQERQRENNTCCSNRTCPKYDNKMYSLIRIVLECLIHDVVYSKKFRYFIESMQNLPSKYYSEFSNEHFDLDEKKQMTKSILNHAPNNLMSEVMQHLLYECVKHHFKLCAQPVFNQTDEVLTKMRCRNTKTKSVYIEKFSFLFDDI